VCVCVCVRHYMIRNENTTDKKALPRITRCGCVTGTDLGLFLEVLFLAVSRCRYVRHCCLRDGQVSCSSLLYLLHLGVGCRFDVVGRANNDLKKTSVCVCVCVRVRVRACARVCEEGRMPDLPDFRKGKINCRCQRVGENRQSMMQYCARRSQTYL
jgi:hypothetical protein